MLKKPSVALAAIALSVTGAQAELADRVVDAAGIDPIVRQLNSIPAFGDVLHVAERIPGRGLARAGELDENPLTGAGISIAGGVIGGVGANMAMTGLADTAASGALVTGGEGMLGNIARFASSNVAGATVAGAGVGMALGYDIPTSPLGVLAPIPMAVPVYGRGLNQAANSDENPLKTWVPLGAFAGGIAGAGAGAVSTLANLTPEQRFLLQTAEHPVFGRTPVLGAAARAEAAAVQEQMVTRAAMGSAGGMVAGGVAGLAIGYGMDGAPMPVMPVSAHGAAHSTITISIPHLAFAPAPLAPVMAYPAPGYAYGHGGRADGALPVALSGASGDAGRGLSRAAGLDENPLGTLGTAATTIGGGFGGAIAAGRAASSLELAEAQFLDSIGFGAAGGALAGFVAGYDLDDVARPKQPGIPLAALTGPGPAIGFGCEINGQMMMFPFGFPLGADNPCR